MRLLVWVVVPLAILLFAAANVHLVYIAVRSQPDCVPHLKDRGGDGQFRAARSAC
jgi:hypothetical protein